MRISQKEPINVGQKYGRLTVLEFVIEKNEKNIKFWSVKCICGTIKKVAAGNLRANTRSCGCLGRELHQNRTRKAPKEASFLHLESVCKYGAVGRHLEYSLTLEEFKTIILKNCYYCDSLPRLYNVYLNSKGKKYNNDITQEWANQQTVYVNGIDRLDNSIGYITDNCVPCCSTCNDMKETSSESSFLTHIEKIYNFQKEKNGKK